MGEENKQSDLGQVKVKYNETVADIVIGVMSFVCFLTGVFLMWYLISMLVIVQGADLHLDYKIAAICCTILSLVVTFLGAMSNRVGKGAVVRFASNCNMLFFIVGVIVLMIVMGKGLK